MEMGIPGDYANPKIKEAYKKVIQACKKFGKTPGMGGVYSEELMSEYIGMGMKFILSGSDLSFMMNSAKQRSENIRSFQKK
jgi:2-keto-3-deoxy-L-rhamnonate aldolase RhmA